VSFATRWNCCIAGEAQTGMKGQDNLTLTYIYLAVGCGTVGVILTFVLVFLCQYLGIDIAKNLWLLVLPVTIAVILNICIIELYQKYRKK
jgi:hypothetical protein